MGQLYEICPICHGTGRMPTVHEGFIRGCLCSPLRVVEVGVTTAKLERLIAESLEGKRIAEVAAIGFDPKERSHG
jgi:hypothetical protein